jgi:uncharacterized damage-inducible protein DinB
MQQSDVLILFGHLYWIRDRILDAADEASVPLVDPDAPTIRDLRTTLIHELDVEWSWRRRLERADRSDFPDDEELDPNDFPTLESIRERWADDEAEMRGWLATLSDEDLAAPCRVERRPTHHPLWFHLQHVYTHGLQQFSDAAVLLTRADASPGEIDFLEYAATLEGQ